jgi:hypothetical protein
MAAPVTGPALAAELEALVAGRVVYFPIRHHSPACAWHLERLLRRWRPQAVLVEGPAEFTPLIPLILHPKTRAPFAIYTSFVEAAPKAPAEPAGPAGAEAPGVRRHAAYYPFCDYSPELLALRTGSELGATLRFIDLGYVEQIRAGAGGEEAAPRVESLLAERHFKRSRYLQALARRAGCRDHNELWDHLFETRLGAGDGGEADPVPEGCRGFIRDVAAWCHFARIDSNPGELAADGTVARERAMAAAIREELAGAAERVLVVTGGFHTVALPCLVTAAPPVARPGRAAKKESAAAHLVRYSFEQLDALNGYAAGMPSPFYYDRLWRARPGLAPAAPKPAGRRRLPARPAPPIPPEDPFSAVAAGVLVELGRLTRCQRLAGALSTADEIAALAQARRLAALRGRPGPAREDLLDGIRSCFVKGAVEAEGEVILGLARQALAGSGIGEVPPEAGSPPIVEDFLATARQLRLGTGDSVRRKALLDLYRKVSHRRASRFLHSLGFLGVPFATLVAGPDFVQGTGLELLQEHWDYQWRPQTESGLIEAGVHGATVAEAAAGRLAGSIAGLQAAGHGGSALDAVGLLVHACQMGLHREAGRLPELIEARVNADPSFTSLAAALNQLLLLWESREPLEAHSLPAIPRLIGAAYARAGYHLHHLADTPAEAAPETVNALITVRDLLHSEAGAGGRLDPALYWEPLSRAPVQAQCPPLLAGAAAGLLHGGGRLPEPELLQLLAGRLHAATGEAGRQIDFLTGLLRTCRELAWRQPALAAAVDALLAGWTNDEFVERLPHLRLAFADLTPRETDQVAALAARLHGVQAPPPTLQPAGDEATLLGAVRLDALVRKSLLEDGLEGWLGAAVGPDPEGRA